MNSFIYGKNTTKGITSIEVKGNSLFIFKADGTYEVKPYNHYLVTAQPFPSSKRLEGDLHYKYLTSFHDKRDYFDALRNCKRQNLDRAKLGMDVEMAMKLDGYTLFNDLPFDAVSALAFDIETTGLTHDETSQVLIISNTYRDTSGNISRRLFSVDEYSSSSEMINDWCQWVRQIDPCIMIGHNVIGFDLPYLQFCSQGGLQLGRLNHYAETDNFTRRFRKDGSQDYDFQDIKIFGRQLIDTWFLAMTYDVGRRYPTYRLKDLIAYEGLEVEGRQHYQAGRIGSDWLNISKRPAIKKYALHDADDALALYDLMAPQYFYYTRSIPKTFQAINNSATGSQINGFLVRSYLQDGHSFPKPTATKKYQGAISLGNAGTYQHLLKVDVASMYPSIILTDTIYDHLKDPKHKLLDMTKWFTAERLKNKQLASETGDRYYKELSEAGKIVINSIYGLFNANGLNFNSADNAARITKRGRDILKLGIKWATDQSFAIVNADTDSFTYTKGRAVSLEEFATDIEAINALYPPSIKWENDGMYHAGIVLKAKNYIFKQGDKLTTKGSAIKSSNKEPALREMLDRMIDCLLADEPGKLPMIYNEYAIEIMNIKDITRWSTKRTVTEAVLNSSDTGQIKLRDAIKDEMLQQGDKFFVYPAIEGLEQKVEKGVPMFYKKTGEPRLQPKRIYRLQENHLPEHTVDTDHLLIRLYDTIKILSTVVNLSLFLNYKLVGNKKLLSEILSDNLTETSHNECSA